MFHVKSAGHALLLHCPVQRRLEGVATDEGTNMASVVRYDWAAWATKYIQGTDDTTYLSLSKEPNSPSEKHLRAKGAAEGWIKQRSEFRSKRAARSLQRALETGIGDTTEIIKGHLSQAAKLQKLADRALDKALAQQEKGELEISLTLAGELASRASVLTKSMLSLAQGQDIQSQFFLDVFIDAVNEVTDDAEKRKMALKRFTEALESARSG